MKLFPAVDIKDGRCVRLKQGLADQVTVFSDDPTEQALRWLDLGADRLHVIDLDGAFQGKPKNFDAVVRIAELCVKRGVAMQLGGGVRDEKSAKAALDAGVSRIIIGTLALTDEAGFAKLAKAFPGKIGVSLDAVDGRLKTKGWVEDSGQCTADVLPRLVDQGAAFIVYTDIARDGMHAGVNVPAMTALVKSSPIPVLAAGGVHDLNDLKALAPLVPLGLEGVVTGRAIYEGTLDFAEALAYANSLA